MKKDYFFELKKEKKEKTEQPTSNNMETQAFLDYSLDQEN